MNTWWMRLLTFIAAIAFSLSIGYSRFVLGMHSMNQIVFGFFLGGWLAFSFHFLGYDPLFNNLKSMLAGEYFDLENKKRFFNTTVITFSVFAIVMVIQIVNFLIVSPTFTAQLIWYQNIIADCGAMPKDSFMALGLIQTGIVAIGFGAYYGVVISCYAFVPADTLEGVPGKRVLSALIMAALALPGGVMYLLFNKFENQVLVLILGQVLPMFLIPFLPFGFKDAICLKLGLVKKQQLLPTSNENATPIETLIQQ